MWKRGRKDPTDASPRTPEHVGPYRIVRELARGGMGVVFVAEDRRLGRSVALKTLSVSEPGARDRLWREARAAAALNHPGICQVYGVEEVDGALWIAMELLEGETLEAAVARERPSVDRAYRVAMDILEPLGFLHDRGLVHRDLKPSNIFLTPTGLKLLDFGLTRDFKGPIEARDSTPDLTRTGAIMGTPRYMAPEQWRGRDVGPRSDLFAWGAIVYEMLAGRNAFEGEDAIDIYHAIAKEQPPPLTGSARLEAMYRVARKAMAKQPEDRFASTRDVVAALRIAATEHASVETTRTRRRKEDQRESVRRFIALPFRVLRPNPDTDFLATSLPEAIGTSLSGFRHLAVRSSQLGVGHDTELDLKRLAADVEVDYALSGTLLSAGPKLRVNAQLLQVPGGTVIWSMQEDAPVDDLFQLHDHLTRRIVDGVQVPLSPAEEARLAQQTSVDPHAFEFYLRGVHLVNQIRTEADLLAVRDLFKEAVTSDPDFAPAWASYGRACRMVAKYLRGESVDAHLERAREAFERAFEIDPDSPVAHNYYTYYQLEELGDSTGAMLRLLDRVNRGTADANLWAGLVPACRFLGLYGASIAAHERAIELDPKIRTGVGLTRLQMGEYERIAESHQPPLIRAVALAALERDQEALTLASSSLHEEFEGTREFFGGGLRAALRNDPEDGRRRLEDARVQGLRDPEAAFFFGRAASHLGLWDLAFQLLTTAIDRGFYGVGALDRDPWIQPVRERPEFGVVFERASNKRQEALAAFRGGGGEFLLGTVAAAEEN